VSQASGTYNLKTAGSGGAGTLTASALEASTVDLSTEFSNLITTQRAYSASSKIITTADQMLQDLINIIR
jgi:flagellar hook protein FlgE